MSKVMFFSTTGGIYLCYLTMSIFSEKLTQYASVIPNESPAKFKFPMLNVWVGCLLCTIFGITRSYLIGQGKSPIPIKQQMLLGGLYTLNISFTNTALLYLSYPIQVLGRNCRLLLVILIGIFFSRVHHKHKHIKLGVNKLIVGIVITIGVILFTFFKDFGKSSNKQIKDQWFGFICLFISVAADAFFSDSQAYCKSNFNKKPMHLTSNHLFTAANFYTLIFSLLISLYQGQLTKQIIFCIEHPAVNYDILIINVLQVIGQYCIYYVVANFKQHVFPLISTTRKVITFLLSILIYKHSINTQQWFAILLILGGLIFQYYDQRKQARERQQHKQKHKEHQEQHHQEDDHLKENQKNVQHRQ